jgi:hypothetical protein
MERTAQGEPAAVRLRKRSTARAGHSSLAYDEYAALLAPRDPGALASAPEGVITGSS